VQLQSDRITNTSYAEMINLPVDRETAVFKPEWFKYLMAHERAADAFLAMSHRSRHVLLALPRRSRTTASQEFLACVVSDLGLQSDASISNNLTKNRNAPSIAVTYELARERTSNYEFHKG
jgi:hypothetical protein